MTRLEIAWPDAALERVHAARGRIEKAAPALRRMTVGDRIDAVARTLASWTAPDSPYRRELVELLGEASPMHHDTVAEGLESALRAWDPARFRDCCRAELASVPFGPPSDGPARGARRIAPFDWTAVLAGGSIPMPTLLSGLLPLVGGSPVLLRETSKDPVTGGLLKRSLAAVQPDLARAFEPVAFPAEDDAALDAFLAAPCVVATGSDETIRAVGHKLQPSQRLVAYGHRFSLAVLGPGCLRDASGLERVVTDLALDVARWDQSGCLSPAVVYLLGIEEEDRPSVAHALSGALERWAGGLPRGEIPVEVLASKAFECEEARMRAAAGRAVLVLDGAGGTVILEDTPAPRPAPLHRFLRLLPVRDEAELLERLEPYRGHLSSVALAGLDEPTEMSLEGALARLGVSRVTEPGRLQTPPVDWPHDGMPLLIPMLRFVQSDRARTP